LRVLLFCFDFSIGLSLLHPAIYYSANVFGTFGAHLPKFSTSSLGYVGSLVEIKTLKNGRIGWRSFSHSFNPLTFRTQLGYVVALQAI